MILSYHKLGEYKQRRMKARITTNKRFASSDGQPVIVLHDGTVLDPFSWNALGYRVILASRAEVYKLAKMGILLSRWPGEGKEVSWVGKWNLEKMPKEITCSECGEKIV